jgi:histidine triad (HIT) family protein
MDCLFCKIAAGEIPSKKIYEDDNVLAFHDIEPQAPVHFLVIPKVHITGADKIGAENEAVVGHVFSAIAKAAKELGLENGFRVVNNCGKDAMQSVEHLHFHVLGGRQLGWPPG